MYVPVTTASAQTASLRSDAGVRAGSLASVLSDLVMERLLEQSDIRTPVRTLVGPTRAVSVALAVHVIDVGAGPRSLDALHTIADLAISTLLDRTAFAVMRPGQGPTFLFPLPAADEAVDEVVALCRKLDEDQLRQQVARGVARFRAAIDHTAHTRDVLIDVQLGEGSIVGATGLVGMLLPSLSWRPA